MRNRTSAGDIHLLFGATLLVIFVPWNLPLIWQARKLRQAIELDCDRRVLVGGADPVRYGHLLLDVGAATTNRMMMAALTASPTLLERRIRVMIRPQGRHWRVVAIASAAIAVAAIAVIAGIQIPGESSLAEAPRVDAVEVPSEFRGAIPAVAVGNAPVDTHVATGANSDNGASPLSDGLQETNRDRQSTSPPHPSRQPGLEPGGPEEPYQVHELDSPPRMSNTSELIQIMHDNYPRILLDAGIDGQALVRLVVRADGSVDPASISVTEATDNRFIDATLAVAEAFQFSPGIYNDSPVPVMIWIPVTWAYSR